jgi:hypothetical protein
MGNWSDSLCRKGFGKRISKDVWKEVKKVSGTVNRDVETRLRERASTIENKSREMLKKYRDLFRIRR